MRRYLEYDINIKEEIFMESSPTKEQLEATRKALEEALKEIIVEGEILLLGDIMVKISHGYISDVYSEIIEEGEC